ncbi:signal peptidase I [Rubripirellula sp.]|nr:signal peptidase I [Rubripirellula sp.]MDB4338646.1 signal peptidase I [Rubripirellula sp.]
MGNRQNKSSARRSHQDSKSASGQESDSRDPTIQRAERFRIAAQRETVEAFIVAFILALLFRAFLAEAFVIPTGSMAPTLMGAHKDISCSKCGTSFQCGASRERSGSGSNLVVVAGVCPNCRYANGLDLENDSNHATFNGDRILVSKFTYALKDPERWDVFVFKYPGNPKQNYIKRLVGLPNETLTIRHGDVYVQPTGSDQPVQIVRKPADTLLSMSHLVYDTDQQSEQLIQANYPSRWQPWFSGAASPPTDSWQVERDADGLTATIDGGSRTDWLRYFHRWPSDDQWASSGEGELLTNVDPYSSRAITDFYAYDSYVHVRSGYVYAKRPSMLQGGLFERMLNGGYSRGVFTPEYQPGVGPEQFGSRAEWGGQDSGRQQVGRDGLHWIGDLILEADLDTSGDSEEAIFELIEAGVKYRCSIDLKTGQAKLTIDDGGEKRPFVAEGGEEFLSPTAETSLRAGSRDQVRFSNCDDQLLLWVNDRLVEFAEPTTFNALAYRSDEQNRPRYEDGHPMDASPAGIAVRGGKAIIRQLRIDRDKYYISNDNSDAAMVDYDMDNLWVQLGQSLTIKGIQRVLADPSSWSDFKGWSSRRRVSFVLSEDQFFPMGDNSPESLDARCWADWKAKIPLPRGVNKKAWQWSDKHFVPRDLLVGKAVVVFWPHSWNSPVPFWPNFKRFKLIR